MKKLLTVLAAAGGLMIAGAAQADADLAKAQGCLNCHAVDAKKVGPAFKEIAAKNKGNKDAPAKLAQELKDGKTASGKTHPKPKGSDDDVKKLVGWVLAQ